jgi:hypothetical protein
MLHVRPVATVLWFYPLPSIGWRAHPLHGVAFTLHFVRVGNIRSSKDSTSYDIAAIRVHLARLLPLCQAEDGQTILACLSSTPAISCCSGYSPGWLPASGIRGIPGTSFRWTSVACRMPRSVTASLSYLSQRMLIAIGHCTLMSIDPAALHERFPPMEPVPLASDDVDVSRVPPISRHHEAGARGSVGHDLLEEAHFWALTPGHPLVRRVRGGGDSCHAASPR